MNYAPLFAAAIAILSTPAFGQVRLGDQLEAIRLSGSEHMMVHTLSTLGLPVQARVAREQLLATMGLRGRPGSVSYTNLSFSPVLTHDSNINGGYASGNFTVGGIPFTIGEKYEAVGGLVLGVSGSGRARIALGYDTALDLRAGASLGYAPEHDMFKTSAVTSACVDHMLDYSTFIHACVDATYRTFDLGETFRVSARAGIDRVFSSDFGMHEASLDRKRFADPLLPLWDHLWESCAEMRHRRGRQNGRLFRRLSGWLRGQDRDLRGPVGSANAERGGTGSDRGGKHGARSEGLRCGASARSDPLAGL